MATKKSLFNQIDFLRCGLIYLVVITESFIEQIDLAKLNQHLEAFESINEVKKMIDGTSEILEKFQ